MADAALAEVSATDLAGLPQYQSLLADCRKICGKAERTVIEQFWRLGERIRRELPSDRDGSYGKNVILALEADLATDRTTLRRADQDHETWTLAEILDNVSTMLTWRKLRMLVALDEPLRKQIEERIRSGELRTDDDVRRAINLLKSDLGLLPPPMGDVEPELFGVKGVSADKLRSLWRHAKPLDRCLLVRALIPEMELEKAARPEALAAIRATREQLDEYERRLGEGAE